MEDKNLDWWAAPIAEFVPPWLLEEGKSVEETWSKGRDTMDVWFDSGSSWAMLPEMGVGRGGATGRTHHADMCLEGSDQHRGWFQSQLLTAIGARTPDEPPVSPYKCLFTHGMVLDEKGKKMSKSLGNVVSPMAIVLGSAVRWFPETVRRFCGTDRNLYRTKSSPRTDLISCDCGLRALTSGRICRSAPL